jgi:hypothetical protein
MMFEYKNKEELFIEYAWSDRQGFANRVCKMFYKINNGDVDKCIASKEFIDVYNDFDRHVRNIYELVDNRIPLFAFYELVNNGADNYDFTKEEYDTHLNKIKQACKEYYS